MKKRKRKRRIRRWRRKYGSTSVGFVSDLSYNHAYQKMELFCPFEHCIESMPLVHGSKSCFTFGHDCPDLTMCPYKSEQEKASAKEVLLNSERVYTTSGR